MAARADHNCTDITDQPDKYDLAVVECKHCRFHLGLDLSYLEQVGSISTTCPGCNLELYISGAE